MDYYPTQKGYKCYDPVSRKIIVSFDVTETNYFLTKNHLQGEILVTDHFRDLQSESVELSLSQSPPILPNVIIDSGFTNTDQHQVSSNGCDKLTDCSQQVTEQVIQGRSIILRKYIYILTTAMP